MDADEFTTALDEWLADVRRVAVAEFQRGTAPSRCVELAIRVIEIRNTIRLKRQETARRTAAKADLPL